MSSSYRMELDKWLKELEVKADAVLDIGGSQLPIKGRTKSWDVKEYVISDLYDPHVLNQKADVVFDLNYPLPSNIQGGYDMIFCLEVFEYIWNPVLAVKSVADLLHGDGTAWITFQSFYPLHQPVEDDALRYMPAGIVKLAEQAGLSVESMIKRRPETDALSIAWTAERMRAAKGEDHYFTGFIVELKK